MGESTPHRMDRGAAQSCVRKDEEVLGQAQTRQKVIAACGSVQGGLSVLGDVLGWRSESVVDTKIEVKHRLPVDRHLIRAITSTDGWLHRNRTVQPRSGRPHAWSQAEGECASGDRNLLAQKSIHDLTAADVENVLSNYELPSPEAHDGLRSLYRSALDYRAKRDLHLSDEEIVELRQLRYVLGLDDADAKSIELELLRDLYRAVLRHALVDGHLSDAEKSKLDVFGTNFDCHRQREIRSIRTKS